MGCHREGVAPGCGGCRFKSVYGTENKRKRLLPKKGSSWENLGNWASAKENLQPPTRNKRSAIMERLPKKAAGRQEAQSKAMCCQ